MQNKAILKMDWATHEAAKYACEHWHYSKCLPTGKTVKVEHAIKQYPKRVTSKDNVASEFHSEEDSVNPIVTLQINEKNNGET